MDTLRKPLFMLALILITLAVLIELGSAGVLQSPGGSAAAFLNQMEPDVAEAYLEAQNDPERRAELNELSQGRDQPGMGIQYLALLDGITLWVIGLMGIALVVPERIHGRVQGCATAVFALLLILGGIVMIFVALGLVLLMVSLLLSAPFGTITYLAVYGSFDRSGASVVLSFLLLLKLGCAICLVVAQQRFLQRKGLVLLLLTSLLGNVVISFLHGFVPGFLVSITDGIAALIVAVLAVLWALFMLIGAIPAIIKVLRVDRALR